MEEGHYATHIRRMRKVYLERYEAFLEYSRQHLSGLLDVQPTEAGLHTIGMLHDSLDDIAAAASAEKQDLTVTPIRRFCIGPTDLNGLLLGFSGFDTKAIRSGIVALASVFEEQLRAPNANQSR